MSDTNTKPTHRSVPVALWASAFVLAGMILGQAGNVGLESSATADVSEVGDLTIATMTISDGSEPVAILSRRSERLFIYGVDGRDSIELLWVQDLDEAFSKGRLQSGNPGR